MVTQTKSQSIRTFDRPDCYLCGSVGQPLYRNLRDRIYTAPGEWMFSCCSSRQCGLIWLNPAPVVDDLHKAYASYYTHQDNRPTLSRIYSAVRNGYLQTHLRYRHNLGGTWQRLFAPLAHVYPTGASHIALQTMFLRAPRSNARLLDVGCGSGHFLVTMQQLGWTVEGLDFDPAAVQAARAHGLLVRQGGLEAQDYPEAAFDVITMSHVIEHVWDPVVLLRTAYRLLRPGGLLVLLTPNAASWGHHRFKQDWRGLEVPRHIYIFAPHNIRRLLGQAGFKHTYVRTLASNARHILAWSADLRQARINERYDVRHPVSEHTVYNMLSQYVERIVCLVLPNAGEEILIAARR